MSDWLEDTVHHFKVQGPWLIYTGAVASIGTLMPDGRVLDDRYDWTIPIGTPVRMFGPTIGTTIKTSWVLDHLLCTRLVLMKSEFERLLTDSGIGVVYPAIGLSNFNEQVIKISEHGIITLFKSGNIAEVSLAPSPTFPKIGAVWQSSDRFLQRTTTTNHY